MKKIQKDEIEEIILCRIKLFAKENYYRYFRNILMELSNNIFVFRKKELLSRPISSKLKERNNSSLWMLIYKLIFPIKNEDDIAEENELNLNYLCFQYLKALCLIRIKKLTNISNNELIPLDQVMSIYLSLCEKMIRIIKEKEKYNLKLKSNNRKKGRKSIVVSQNDLMNIMTQFKLKHKKLGMKSGPSMKPLDYTNSYTRLFIGETDDTSVRERYLSNMVVKKHKQLHLLNNYGELSIMYLKRMYKKLFKNEERVNMDNDMIKIMKQFENDHKRIDNFQRGAGNSDRPRYMYDYTQNLLAMELKKQKEKYDKKIKSKRNRNKFKNNSLLASSEISKNNQESGFSLSSSRRYKAKSFFHSIYYEKKKLGDSSIFSTRIINPYNSNKISHIKKLNTNLTDRRFKRNHSAILVSSRINHNKSSNLDNKKRLRIKNYLTKKDFFFS